MDELFITNTQAYVQPDGSIGYIFKVAYSAQRTDNDLVANYVSEVAIPTNYVLAQIPYDTVTVADCQAWVTELHGQRIQDGLDAAMAAQAKPEVRNGFPWNNSYPDWVLGHAYSVGDIVGYWTPLPPYQIPEFVMFKCVQAHISQSDWTPPAVPALWTIYYDPAAGPQPWVQPTGAQDAYAIGAQVTHNGNLWESTVADNVWEPGVFGWTDLGAYP